MPNTTNFNWPTPADTDLVKDGAAAIRNLGDGVDTSLVDLKGGTTGQILSKASDTDMDFAFITPNVGDLTEVQAGTGISVADGTGPIPIVTNTVATEFDAKGDLVVGTGSDTFDRLAVGTDGYTLVADSSVSPTGLKWAAPASGTTFAGCSLYRTVDQTGIASATNTAILWDAQHFDTDAYHSTVTNTSRITIPSGKAGKYLICGMTEINLLSATKVQTIIYLNGSIVRYAGDYQGTGTNVKGPYSIVLDLGVNDYIEIFARQDSGSNADATGGTQRINVSVSLLGA
jgi:hypothetical protein